MKKRNRISKGRYVVIFILLFLAMADSLFLLYEHFTPNVSKFCTFGESFDCGIVNKSPYANIDGISFLLTIDFSLPLPLINLSDINFFSDLMTSNAFLGFLTMLFLLGLILALKNGKGFLWIEKGNVLKWAKGITLFSLLYGFYLFLIQHFILKTYCILCIALDLLIVSLLIMVWRYK